MKKKSTSTSLPKSRVARIMQSAVGVGQVNNDVISLTTKATELFLADLAKGVQKKIQYDSRSMNRLEYTDIQQLIHEESKYDFLRETTPPKIRLKSALELIQETYNQRAPHK